MALFVFVLLVMLGCGGGGGGPQPLMCLQDVLELPDVSGSWLVHDLSLASSDCSSEVDDRLQDAINESNNCVFQVSQDNTSITAVDCGDRVWQGCVNEAGDVTISTSDSDTDVGCTVRVDGLIAANLATSPTTGTLTLGVHFSGTCAFADDCSATVNAMATEQEAAAGPAGSAVPH